MLIWMCALHCEAKPVIDLYRLQKATTYHGFDLYRNGDMTCIISGIGALNMAAATAWAAALFKKQQPLGWINLGIAGHRSLPVGNLVTVDRVSSSEHPRAFDLHPIIDHNTPPGPLISYSEAQEHYPEKALVDMEAYAFIRTAIRFSDIKWCHSLKIISDNQYSGAHKDKPAISGLIQNNMLTIDQYVNAILQEIKRNRE